MAQVKAFLLATGSQQMLFYMIATVLLALITRRLFIRGINLFTDEDEHLFHSGWYFAFQALIVLFFAALTLLSGGMAVRIFFS